MTRVLAVVVGGLIGACGLLMFLNHGLRSENADLRAGFEMAAAMTEQAGRQVTQLSEERTALLDKLAADIAAAQYAEARLVEAEAKRLALEDENAQYREDIATADARVREWMSAGVPVRVACSMWPGQAACTN